MQLIFNSPLNSVSFGNVSYNLLRELHEKGDDVGFFPVAGNADIGAFDKAPEDFRKWVTAAYNDRYKKLSKDTPSFRLWHLSGSEERIGRRQYLYTFYELDQPTEEEIRICDLQDHIFVSCEYAKNNLVLSGVDPEKITVAPLGVDKDLSTEISAPLEGPINFGLMGKMEKRKHTAKILRLWAKKYGKNLKYTLNCLIDNPFFKEGEANQFIREALGNERYFNINFVSRLPTNSQVESFMRKVDIDLTGLSGAEGWNLPSFNCVALGKNAVVLNATAHKDWATEDNAFLVEPNGMLPAEDGRFFANGGPFNQGRIYDWDEDEAVAAMEKAVKVAKLTNVNGLKLREGFTYKKTLDIILSKMK